MLRLRILSSLIGIPLLFLILYQAGWWWKGLFIVMGIIALYEYFNMMSQKGYRPAYLASYLILIILLSTADNDSYLFPAFFLIIVLLTFFLIVNHPNMNINDVALSFFGTCYIGFLLSYSWKILYLDNSFWIIVLCFLVTWASDSGGYFVGVSLGKNKMTPYLSPNKTWEGALGAVVLTSLTTILFFSLPILEPLKYSKVLMLGVTASILAQMGDLMVSAIKRFFGVKDTGRIIPGHGGILDRFDSFIMVLPLVYYFFLYCY
jgi:phosphatidate cytidylyltransferase